MVPDLTHLMSRETIAAGAALNNRENLRLWVKDPDAFKPGVAYAGHATGRSRTSTQSPTICRVCVNHMGNE